MDDRKWVNIIFIIEMYIVWMEVIQYKNEKYPELLKKIYKPPQMLYCYGDSSFLSINKVSIIGTRQISDYGKWVIRYVLAGIAKQSDIVVVSGLACGVDAYVHMVCLSMGIKTIAVVPGGVDTAIPSCNIKLAKRIVREGLLIAEYPSGTSMGKLMYVMRNRVVAGISKYCIVIEAGVNSGSLITANFAIEYNRDVYVVPGNINSPVSQGCNELAKQGAYILSSVSDLNEIIGIRDEQLLLR